MSDNPQYTLAQGQGFFLDTLHNGPGHCPEDLFSTSISRTIGGLKAHANTVSHARLIALEETYPRTMQRLDALYGKGHFNTLCRDFVQRDEAKAAAMMRIGAGFSDFLKESDTDAASADLGAIEYAWLESYHAADAEPLTLAHIAGLQEETLLALPLRIHPSVRIVALSAPLAEELEELKEHRDAAAIVTVRPDAEVLFHPWPPETARIFAATAAADEKNRTLGNLLAGAAELVGDDNVQPLVLSLIQAGIFAAPE